MDTVTIYYPGDGVKENSNTALYTNIKDFKQNPNQTITFKTQKGEIVTTPLLWRLKQGCAEEAAAPAANARGHRGY